VCARIVETLHVDTPTDIMAVISSSAVTVRETTNKYVDRWATATFTHVTIVHDGEESTNLPHLDSRVTIHADISHLAVQKEKQTQGAILYSSVLRPGLELFLGCRLLGDVFLAGEARFVLAS